MYQERRVSLSLQAQSGIDAIGYLNDTIAALDVAIEANHCKLIPEFDCQVMLTLHERFVSQVDELNTELSMAHRLLAEIENTVGPRRAIDVVLSVKRDSLKAELLDALTKLKEANLQLHYCEREGMNNLEALW